MRLIDADALLEGFRKCYNGHLGMENSDSIMTFRSICKIINNQPTAYDLDKVVEQMKKDSAVKLYGSNNSNNYLIPIEKAVEIVKGGGVDA